MMIVGIGFVRTARVLVDGYHQATVVVTPMPRGYSGRRRPAAAIGEAYATGVIQPDLKITLRPGSESSEATVHAITCDALSSSVDGRDQSRRTRPQRR
jgi:hypothetical protein